MGFGAIAKPAFVTAQFGILELTQAGRNEVRAVYGGFGIFVLKTAVDGRKTLQVAVEIEQFERRSLTDLELLRSRENRPESLANTRSALFGSHDNRGF